MLTTSSANTRLLLIAVILAWLLPATSLQAQKGKPLAMEFSTDLYGDNITHMPCDSNGLCVFYLSGPEDSTSFNLLHFDRNFQQVHNLQFRIPIYQEMVSFTYDNNELVILFQEKIKKKKSELGTLLRYNCVSKVSDTLSVKGMPAGNIISIKSATPLLLFSAYSANNKQSNLYYLYQGDNFVHPLHIPDAIAYQVEDFGIDSAARHVLVALNSTLDNHPFIWLCETDYQQNILTLTELPDTLSYRCESLCMTHLNSCQWLLAGTYATRKNNATLGVYTLPYHMGTFDSLRLHPYAAISVVAPNNATYTHSPGKITRYGEQIAFITETFQPEYRDRPVYYYGVMTYEYSFYGYRYRNADVHVFNPDGTDAWYYNFPYDDILTQNTGTYLNIAFIRDMYLLYYTRSNNMTTMLTNANTDIIDSKRSSTIFPETPNSAISYDGTRITQWYGDYFLVSGYKRNTKSSRASTTYFIQKLWYR